MLEATEINTVHFEFDLNKSVHLRILRLCFFHLQCQMRRQEIHQQHEQTTWVHGVLQ